MNEPTIHHLIDQKQEVGVAKTTKTRAAAKVRAEKNGAARAAGSDWRKGVLNGNYAEVLRLISRANGATKDEIKAELGMTSGTASNLVHRVRVAVEVNSKGKAKRHTIAIVPSEGSERRPYKLVDAE